MIKWWDLTDQQRDELVALHVLKWEKINEQWFEQNEKGRFEVPVILFPFTTDEELAWKLLRSFDNWQVTKMFPLHTELLFLQISTVVYQSHFQRQFVKQH